MCTNTLSSRTAKLLYVSVVCARAEAKGSEGTWLQPVALSQGEQVTADFLAKNDMRGGFLFLFSFFF